MNSSINGTTSAGSARLRQVFLHTVLPVFFLLLFTGASFGFTFQNGWTTWDDDVYVVDNPYVRGVSPENVAAIWTKQFNGSYLPLTMMSYMLEYSIGEYDPSVYHLTSLLLHLANTVLVYLFIWRLSKRNLFAAFVTAMVFGIHPMHVESVAWISARKDVLSGFFFLWSLIAYLGYVQGARHRRLILSFLFFVFALFSKIVVITLPLLLLLVDRYHGREWHKNLLLEKIPFFAAGILFSLIGVYAQHAAEAIRPTSVGQFFAMPHYALLFYLEKFLLPINLSAFYPYPKINDGVFPAAVYLSVPVIYSIVYAAWRNRKQTDLIFGLLFFLILMFPVLQHIRFSNIIAEDRFTYLAYIGLTYPIGMWFGRFYERSSRQRQQPMIVIGIVLILLMHLGTSERVKVWKDGRTLWGDVLKKYPDALQ